MTSDEEGVCPCTDCMPKGEQSSNEKHSNCNFYLDFNPFLLQINEHCHWNNAIWFGSRLHIQFHFTDFSSRCNSELC